MLFTTALILNGCTQTTSVTTPSSSNPSDPVTSSSPSSGESDTLKVQAIITQKCAYCHSLSPTGSNGPAAGIIFDTYDQMVQRAKQIKVEVVDERAMPKPPITMTEEERALIGSWADAN